MAEPADFPAIAPSRIGISDVEQLESQTKALRAADYRYGGGTCRDAVVVRIYWGQMMLGASTTDAVRDRLLSAIADLHNLAGWTCFDTGQVAAANHHFHRAVEFAHSNAELTANIVYRQGRVHLHHGDLDQALTLFQRPAPSALSASIFLVNQAWTYAKQGLADEALRALGKAEDEYARADVTQPADWARFFDDTDLTSMIGTVHTELGDTQRAIPALTSAINGFGPEMARSRTFCLISLGICHMLDGDVDEGVAVSDQAVRATEGVQSARVLDRMKPLSWLLADRGAQPSNE